MSNVGQKVKQEIKNNSFVILVSLVIITIPLHYRYCNSAIILLLLYKVVEYKNNNFTFQKNLFLPIALYLLMCLSLLWSIDFKESLQALSKGITLLLLPICFFINPLLSKPDVNKVLRYFAYSFLGYTVFYLIKAVVRFCIIGDINVFFYHELVTFDVNAIHVSVYISVVFFYFFVKKNKSRLDKVALVLLLLFLVLLSSKNVIIVFLGLLITSTFWVLKVKWNPTRIILVTITTFLLGLVFYVKLKDRFLIEIQSNTTLENSNNKMRQPSVLVANVSIKDAWSKEKFQANDFFAGTALRVYQARVFGEMLQEDKIFFTGFGLNAVQSKIIKKRKEHNLYFGYDKFNFHNQYIQIFAELGVFGLLLLLAIIGVSLKNAIKNKDFIHFSFTILMISLFLTESFLSRQRGIVFFVMMYCLFNVRIKETNFTS